MEALIWSLDANVQVVNSSLSKKRGITGVFGFQSAWKPIQSFEEENRRKADTYTTRLPTGNLQVHHVRVRVQPLVEDLEASKWEIVVVLVGRMPPRLERSQHSGKAQYERCAEEITSCEH